MKTPLLLFTLLLLFEGCSRRLPPKRHDASLPKEKKLFINASSKKKSPAENSALKKLYAQYRLWKGTPYRYGGLSLKGVDCSGFVLDTYKKVYGISLPRSTKEQVKKGRVVYRYELRTGDLLFFKTGWNVRHVGIYLKEGKFMHASTSKGVVISHINNPYWKKRYWQARRLF